MSIKIGKLPPKSGELAALNLERQSEEKHLGCDYFTAAFPED
jgi:hypothetical protein